MKETKARSEKLLKFLENWLWPILEKIFRIEVSGLENLPSTGPSLIIANHNSGALIESHALLCLTRQRKINAFGLNHQALFLIPGVGQYFRAIGAITASKQAAHEALSQGAAVLIFPGGNRQALRPFSQRNQNDFPWAKGWADIATEAQVPVIPIKFIGSHAINPIFISSKWLARILILPALFKVTYFPVSLSQLILTALTVAILGSGSPWIVGLAAYLVFCFTPLVPVWPAKVKIKIYPALKPQEDFIHAESLREKMNELMTQKDYAQGPRKKFELNGLERFMLAQENESNHFNSQFVFEFEGPPLTEKILQTTEKWVQLLPQTRSIVETGFYQSQRYIYENAWFNARDLFSFESTLDQKVMDEFSYRPFSLCSESPVRFLLQTDGKNSRLVFSCHHTIFDGAGQAFAFELWARIYNGQQPQQASLARFQYRSVIGKLGLKKCAALFLQNFQLRPSRNDFNLGHFVQKPDHGQRLVRSVTYYLNDSHDYLRNDFLPVVAQAIDKSLTKLGHPTQPIILYAPTGLRWVMKAHSTFQNTLVSQVLFIKRQQSFEDLRQKIQTKMKSDLILANSKFLFGTLPFAKIMSSKKLSEKMTKFNSPKAHVHCTALAVSAVFPKSFPIPKDWTNLRIAGRGSLFRSPPIGVILTGIRGKETLTIEYVESLVKEETVQLLARYIFTS